LADVVWWGWEGIQLRMEMESGDIGG